MSMLNSKMLRRTDVPLGFFANAHCAGAAVQYDLTCGVPSQQDWATLLPKHILGSVPKRQTEFIAGRTCAARAIVELTGHNPDILPITPNGTARWPKSLVGSITHSKGYAWAVAAYQSTWESVGIDSERIMSEKSKKRVSAMQSMVCVSGEQELGCDQNIDLLTTLTLVFSIKESIYKCLFPVVQKNFGFRCIRVTSLDVTRGTYEFRLLSQINNRFKSGFTHHGQFAIGPPFVHSIVVLEIP